MQGFLCLLSIEPEDAWKPENIPKNLENLYKLKVNKGSLFPLQRNISLLISPIIPCCPVSADSPGFFANAAYNFVSLRYYFRCRLCLGIFYKFIQNGLIFNRHVQSQWEIFFKYGLVWFFISSKTKTTTNTAFSASVARKITRFVTSNTFREILPNRARNKLPLHKRDSFHMLWTGKLLSLNRNNNPVKIPSRHT